jgi:hypothetical protein
MALYVGLDVSLRTISVCIVEAKGKVVWEGKVLCEGPALITALARPQEDQVRRDRGGPALRVAARHPDRVPLQRGVHRGASRAPVPFLATEQDRPQ